MLLSNYLFFTTDCEQALGFYTACGLGRVMVLVRYGEIVMPPPGMQDKVMHARFEGPGILFHASDNADAEPMRGSAHMLMTDSRAETDLLFDRLAERGTVTTKLGIQPWGDYYGKLTDKFGVQWMLNFHADAP